MHCEMILPVDDAIRAALLDDAMTLAEQHISAWCRRCGTPVNDTRATNLLDAAVRSTLWRYHCGPVFPGLGALVDAIDENDDGADEDARQLHL